MAIFGQVFRPPAFEIDTGQIIKHQAHALGKGARVELLFQVHPMAVELIHGGVEIVLVKGLIRRQTAGLGQPGAIGLVRQREFGTGKEQPAIKDGLKQAVLPGRAQVGEEFGQAKTRPGVVEHRQATVVQRVMELDRVCGVEVLALREAAMRSRVGAGKLVILQTVRERGPSGVRKDSRTR